MTSHQVVGRIRRIFGTRKVGHAGTLDPMATGVLLIGINRATRLLGHLALHDKAYLATIRLGAATSTDDAQGEIVTGSDASAIPAPAVEEAMAGLRGEIMQAPSAVSAIKVDGKRAYARVRAGEEVSLAPRPVTVSRFDVLSASREATFLDLRVVVECSSGTYIRALARDLGAALGVGGHLTALRRTRIGKYRLDQACELDSLTDQSRIMTMAEAARLSFPVVELDEGQALDVRHGRVLRRALPASPTGVISPDGEFLGLYGQDGRAIAVLAG